MSDSIIEMSHAISNLKLLIVEPDDFLGRLMKGTFNEMGIEIVDLVQNNEDSVSMSKLNSYDVILYDLSHPITDSFKYLSMLTEHNDNIIVLNQFSENAYITELEVMGIKKYLKKPLDFFNAVDAIYEITHEKSANE